MLKKWALAIGTVLLTLLLAVVLGGGGHGWLAPFSLFPVTMFLTPLSIISVNTRGPNPPWSRFSAALCLIIWLGFDYLFFKWMGAEEMHYLHRAWARAPIVLIGWFACLGLPQLLVLCTCVRLPKRCASDVK